MRYWHKIILYIFLNIRKLEMEAADEAKCWLQTHFQWPGRWEGQAASTPFGLL